MSSLVLLDTHALVWLFFGEADIGNEARQLADTAAKEDRLLVAAISFWEGAGALKAMNAGKNGGK